MRELSYRKGDRTMRPHTSAL